MPHSYDLEEDMINMIKDSEERIKEKREKRMNNARWLKEYFRELPDELEPFFYIMVAVAVILTVVFAIICALLLIKFGIWLFT